jgi:hypothetical protein
MSIFFCARRAGLFAGRDVHPLSRGASLVRDTRLHRISRVPQEFCVDADNL